MSSVFDPILLYSTFGERENALEVARGIVRSRLGACVNLLPGAQSFYEWEGQLEEACEIVMFVKSDKSKEKDLIEYIVSHHCYEEPAIVTIPITGGAGDYLEWAQVQLNKPRF